MWSSKARLGKRKGPFQYSEDKIIWNIEIACAVIAIRGAAEWSLERFEFVWTSPRLT